MPKRIKRIVNDTPWPASWVVSKTWDIPTSIKLPRGSVRTLESRKFEVALKGSPSTFYLFERHVHNTDNDAEWIDAFQLHPHNCFTSFRADRIVKVRNHIPPKKRTVTVPDSNHLLSED